MKNHLTPIELSSQRVMTTEYLADAYEATTKMLNNNYANNWTMFFPTTEN